jgi:hypothetical protein
MMVSVPDPAKVLVDTVRSEAATSPVGECWTI